MQRIHISFLWCKTPLKRGLKKMYLGLINFRNAISFIKSSLKKTMEKQRTGYSKLILLGEEGSGADGKAQNPSFLIQQFSVLSNSDLLKIISALVKMVCRFLSCNIFLPYSWRPISLRIMVSDKIQSLCKFHCHKVLYFTPLIDITTLTVLCCFIHLMLTRKLAYCLVQIT